MFLHKIRRRLCFYLYCIGYKQKKWQGVNLIRRFFNIKIIGINNEITMQSRLRKSVRIVIYGSNNVIRIGPHVTLKRGLLWIEDSNCSIEIKSDTTIEDAEIAVAENGHSIVIGKDCMISKGVRMATSDAHSIIDVASKERLNYAKNIIIGNHVWIGNGAYINKGVNIASGSIIGARSVVTRDIPTNTVAAGIPAKVIKTDVTWTRIRL